MKHLGDITKINGHEIEPVDCICGGSPCQDLSVGGLKAGLAGERSRLFFEQIRIVKEMREDVRTDTRANNNIRPRPRYMVWENVPGAFTSNGGEDFRSALTEIVRIVRTNAPAVPLPVGGWRKSGCIMGYGDSGQPFSIAWRLHDAQLWGVPQRRKRVAIIADFGGLSAPEICFERKGLRGDYKEGEEKGADVAGTVDADTNHAICFTDGFINVSKDKTITLRARDYKYPPCVLWGGIARRLTPLEFERLQGFPDGWTDIGIWEDGNGKKHNPSDTPRYKALGNSIALPFWFWLLRRISAQYERPATMGSLFDGIGGFPLCWERCNGTGTARWASEVDEFAITVTKKRFPEVQ